MMVSNRWTVTARGPRRNEANTSLRIGNFVFLAHLGVSLIPTQSVLVSVASIHSESSTYHQNAVPKFTCRLLNSREMRCDPGGTFEYSTGVEL
jgi:hypothetical protein